jgi:hypothetical protein
MHEFPFDCMVFLINPLAVSLALLKRKWGFYVLDIIYNLLASFLFILNLIISLVYTPEMWKTVSKQW